MQKGKDLLKSEDGAKENRDPAMRDTTEQGSVFEKLKERLIVFFLG